jgi:hypothetical protein
MSAEKFLKILEVSKANLYDYLLLIKKIGFRLIALE